MKSKYFSAAEFIMESAESISSLKILTNSVKPQSLTAGEPFMSSRQSSRHICGDRMRSLRLDLSIRGSRSERRDSRSRTAHHRIWSEYGED